MFITSEMEAKSNNEKTILLNVIIFTKIEIKIPIDIY